MVSCERSLSAKLVPFICLDWQILLPFIRISCVYLDYSLKKLACAFFHTSFSFQQSFDLANMFASINEICWSVQRSAFIYWNILSRQAVYWCVRLFFLCLFLSLCVIESIPKISFFVSIYHCNENKERCELFPMIFPLSWFLILKLRQ